MDKMDEGLKGNEKIEEAIYALQKEASQEMLAHVLTVIRRRMKDGGQLIVAVNESMQMQVIRDEQGKQWFAAYTGFAEQIKGGNQVMSTFLSGIEPLFAMALKAEEIEGVIINPWNRTIQLDKDLLRIIKG